MSGWRADCLVDSFVCFYWCFDESFWTILIFVEYVCLILYIVSSSALLPPLRFFHVLLCFELGIRLTMFFCLIIDAFVKCSKLIYDISYFTKYQY